ncbi:MAG: methionyl-tRNA formyltransferase [Burkholderiales bacterium]
MKLIFAGTPPFAAAALSALHDAGHEVALVLTQPDRPAGRGMKLTASAVALPAGSLGLPTLKPVSLKDDAIQAALRQVNADVMVVAAYGLLLPKAVLDIPRHGCINIHASLLPRWRGAAPIQRAIEAGDGETGIDIMQMEVGLDTGPVLHERRIAVAPDDTAATLTEKLTALGATAIVEALHDLPSLTPRPQDAALASYANKLSKSEAIIDWAAPASQIERRLRAFDPFPGCETRLGGERLRIWRGKVVPRAQAAAPGEIYATSPHELVIACGVDALQVLQAQRDGGKRVQVHDLLQSMPLKVGQKCQ